MMSLSLLSPSRMSRTRDLDGGFYSLPGGKGIKSLTTNDNCVRAQLPLTAALLLLPFLAAAQESASFLKIGVGARALGMGGAFTAIADDVTAMSWNPGGLGGLKQRELG